MSLVKRYVEDKCEEIAKATGRSWDEVMDIFNDLNECYVGGGVTEDELWAGIEAVCVERNRKNITYEPSYIETGYIPVEYHLYKELINKAAKYDKIQDYLAKLGGEKDADVQIRDIEKESVLATEA